MQSPRYLSKSRLAALLALFVLIPVLHARGQESPEGPAPLFQAGERLQFTLEAPFRSILQSRGEDAQYFPARLTVGDAKETIGLEIKTRGNFRNRESICRFPPLMLDFPRDEMEGTLFAGENRLKLVTHCQPRARYRQYVLLEYLAYKTLNLLSDISLGVRLLELRYVDSESGRQVATEPGFLVESVESLARRRGLGEVTVPRLRREWYDEEQLTLVTLFHYLLGSVDWSALIGAEGESCCHNIEPLQDRADGDFIALAHDFDMSGLVDPSYGTVPRQLGIRRLTQRLYRGACPDEEVLARTLALFREKREPIQALFASQEGLSESVRAQSLAFIDDFYEVIDDSESVRAELRVNCR